MNDYLVTRDAEEMGPVYAALGLTVGTITEEMDPDARRKAYACDITYCSNKQLVFDYLKDKLALGSGDPGLKLKLESLHSDRAAAHGSDCFFAVCTSPSSTRPTACSSTKRARPLILSAQGQSEEQVKVCRQALFSRRPAARWRRLLYCTPVNASSNFSNAANSA